jgi:hypothetical protein
VKTPTCHDIERQPRNPAPRRRILRASTSRFYLAGGATGDTLPTLLEPEGIAANAIRTASRGVASEAGGGHLPGWWPPAGLESEAK